MQLQPKRCESHGAVHGVSHDSPPTRRLSLATAGMTGATSRLHSLTLTKIFQVCFLPTTILSLDIPLGGSFYAQPRSLSARPAFHILVIWAILSPSNCIT